MKVLFYSARPYDRDSMQTANGGRHQLEFTEARLDEKTALLAQGFDAVCGFVNDCFTAPVLQSLKAAGVRLVLLRCTGFNNIDLTAAQANNICVMRVCRYSPYAVAEFAVTLMLALNRKVHHAYNKVREDNFLLDGLLGFDLNGKTVGIVGTGKIGRVLARILNGFGCTIRAYDLRENDACKEAGVRYVPLPELLRSSDIVSLHVPLTPQTQHMIGAEALATMKPGAMLINTSRGGLIDTMALIQALKARRLGAVGLDVYEGEGDLFFRDLSGQVMQDDIFVRLLSFPNVLVTGHQSFLTQEALRDIAQTTISNADDFIAGRTNENCLKP
ncbi:MAG: 2-hydroxyacid dehydrogenase [Alphaproteobacteria bacterium]